MQFTFIAFHQALAMIVAPSGFAWVFTGSRSTVFFLDAANPDPVKAEVFRAVEAWLRGKRLI